MILVTELLWKELLCRAAGEFALRPTFHTEATLWNSHFQLTQRGYATRPFYKSHPSSVSWQAVIQKFQIQQSSIAAFWSGGKKIPNPHTYLAKAKRHFSDTTTSRLLIWKIKDLLINRKYIFKAIKIADWRYCERQMQYLLLCVPNPVLIYRIKWNNQIKILFQNYISVAEKVISF